MGFPKLTTESAVTNYSNKIFYESTEIYKLSKITKMAVFYSDNQIVFLIKIPLITKIELTLYRILPISHPLETKVNEEIDDKHGIILKLEFQYVGITKNRRKYTIFTETHAVTTLYRSGNIYDLSQVSNNTTRIKNQLCEISLFKNLNILPQKCKAGIIILSKNIFHKLKYANTWIYTTQGETITITFLGNKESYLVKIKNQDVIKLNQECRTYAGDVILNPTRDIKSSYYVNFILQVWIGKLLITLPNK